MCGACSSCSHPQVRHQVCIPLSENPEPSQLSMMLGNSVCIDMDVIPVIGGCSSEALAHSLYLESLSCCEESENPCKNIFWNVGEIDTTSLLRLILQHDIYPASSCRCSIKM